MATGIDLSSSAKTQPALKPFPLEFKTYRITVMRKAKTKIRKNTWIAWSEDEIELLKRLFPCGGAGEIAKQTGRPLTAVRQKAYNMGIKTDKYHFWLANEIQLLKELYPNESIHNIAEKLGRSEQAIRDKAYIAGLKDKKEKAPLWSNQEIALFKKMYPDNSIRDIANKLGRTVLAVQQKAYKLGLRKSIHVWSKRELNLLKKLYPSRTAQEIAEQLGRPVQATRKIIVRLGFKKRLRYEYLHRVVNGVMQKLCRTCKIWKSENEFYKDSSRKDGLNNQCKKCSCKATSKSGKRRSAVEG